MSKSTLLRIGAAGAVLLILAVAVLWKSMPVPLEPDLDAAPSQALESPAAGFLYGRITTGDGTTYEGRLRLGGDEESFWGDYFNGTKDENPWRAHVPPERLIRERPPLKLPGFEISRRPRQIDLGRPFMARFGDIARIAVDGRDLRVTLKSGTVFHLNRLGADDVADGVRVWDRKRGVVDLNELRIRTIEFIPIPRPGAAPDRLHGTVRTRQGDVSGFVQWNRAKSVGSDTLDGHTDDGELSLPFNTLRSIARDTRDSSRVTLLDGREVVLSDTSDVGQGNRGIYVDDRRYGRVLVSWDAFERIDFSPGGSSPDYDDFPQGSPLSGSVTTRTGRHIAGRLVFDLDESESTETLDAPSQGVNYTIPFGLIASIVSPSRVTLHDGEELHLERSGDLGDGNAGMLIFVEGRPSPEYVPWSDVMQIALDRPAAMVPPH